MFGKSLRVIFLTLILTVLTGVIYPLGITLAAQALMPWQANGSLIEQNGKTIGSDLIAQGFARPDYFQPRPSAAGNGYDAANSSGSNLAVTSKDLIKSFNDRIAAQQKLNGDAAAIPADLVTASASGLDPDITPEAARYQAPRIAQARHLKPEDVETLISRLTQGRTLGILGMPRVNVLALNRELDKMAGQPAMK